MNIAINARSALWWAYAGVQLLAPPRIYEEAAGFRRLGRRGRGERGQKKPSRWDARTAVHLGVELARMAVAVSHRMSGVVSQTRAGAGQRARM